MERKDCKIKNETDIVHGRRFHHSPLFAKTTREWILASALYDGIEDEDIRQIEVLVSERGANPNVLLPEYGITPFHLAVANESIRFAVHATDICLQHGADPNVRSEDGLTPVHLAAMWGCPEVLRVLLAAGGNPWLVDSLNKNSFDYAETEKQKECLEILNSQCNSQPKLSGHSKSPYQLNLKRVTLYKNDLEIVYEASPRSSKKTTATQTSSSFQCLSDEERVNYSEKQHKNAECEDSGVNNSKEKRISSLKKNSCFSSSNKNISCELKEAILNHRRNSTVFEYCPSEEDGEKSSSGVTSWRDFNSSGISSGVVSELVEKLEQANKIRQSLKSNCNSRDLLRNVTERRKPLQKFHPTSTPESSTSYVSCQNERPQSKIGFILDDSRPLKRNATMTAESPPSIGFILDAMDKTCDGSRGSSLFSDIASDIEVFTTPQQNIEEIMTEDEDYLKKKDFSRYSSSNSLYPNVSSPDRVGQEEVESSAMYESCQDKTLDTSVKSVNREVHSLLESILGTIESEKSTPVNKKLVTSTPERVSCGSDETSFTSAVDDRADSSDRGWVQAVVTSSSEEDQYMSISEEYQYTDLEEGVVLIEKRHLVNELSITADGKMKKGKKAVPSSGSEESTEVSSLTGSDNAYDTDELRQALKQHGFTAGPINGSTKRVYLRRLKRFLRKPPLTMPQTTHPAYSPELTRTLDATCEHLLLDWAHLEDSMAASFSCSKRPWRQGQAKTSFTYLLLDPRLTPSCPPGAPHASLWPQFLRAVIYVGKGKRARPYAHLYQAVRVWQTHHTHNSAKVKRILDIWSSGQGVVCLHVFQNIIPVEALTREAAMIAALTLPQLTNEKAGEFYGSAASWSERLKRRLGCVLLHRAYRVFLAEGERQLRPADID